MQVILGQTLCFALDQAAEQVLSCWLCNSITAIKHDDACSETCFESQTYCLQEATPVSCLLELELLYQPLVHCR